MEDKKSFVEGGGSSKTLNLKATELRLGLPGSESPDRVSGDNVDPIMSLKSSFGSSGAKRVFLDTISNGSEAMGLLFSPRGGSKLVSGSEESGGGGGGACVNAVVVPQSLKQLVVAQEKKASHGVAPNKAQVVGWPPIRSFRKNTMASQSVKTEEDKEQEAKQGFVCLYVKVSMDGAPYLRKVDLKTYCSYMELSSALEKMFGCFTIGQFGSHGAQTRDGLNESRLVDLLHGSEYVLTYEDKDSDWMLVGDVPWKMFTNSCKRLRIMKSSEAIGLAPRAMEKCKSRA
jgi:auxin-responsive protein IAA